MKNRVRTLLVDANGWSVRAAVADTVFQGVFGLDGPGFLERHPGTKPFLKRLVGERYSTMSYGLDWRDAFLTSPALQVDPINILNLAETWKLRRRIADYDLVVILHTAMGDSMRLLSRLADLFARRDGELVVFIGNEYDLMDEKIAFIQSAGAQYICTQLPVESARWLYEECHTARVVAMPHALNPDLYYPDRATARTIDAAFVGSLYPVFVGDVERTDFIRLVEREAPGWGVTFEFVPDRFERQAWAGYLRRCHAVIGAESGTYFLDKRGRAIAAARDYARSHPDVTCADLVEKFFKPLTSYVSGKAVSSRHFEPAGTKTCQVLLEGHYNGLLKADEHYIAVSRDGSNAREAFERLKAESYRQEIVERTYQYVMDQHTYAHRVASLLRELSLD